ncbi:MAG: hypothetical protein A2066_03030 [Bacteroidetes bacterium GWB2_41_8]|nr:MAG: hypothetical protein A2066_03030 [Bacteroidetes bacterium GWB2_41_8]
MKLKTHFYIGIIAALLLAIAGCSDDFLTARNNSVHQLDTIYISPVSQNYAGPLSLPIDVSEPYTIIMQPSCMTFSSQKGKFVNGTTQLEFSTDMSNYSGMTGYIGQHLVLYVENVGTLVFMVAIGSPGNPDGTNQDAPFIQVSESVVDLQNNDSKVLTIRNTGNANLTFQFKEIPGWLTFSTLQGMLYPGQSTDITLVVNRNNLEENEYSAIVQIQNNTPQGNYGLLVKMKVSNLTNPENTKAIQGQVTDSEYNKITNQLLVTTQIPNQLIIFSTSDNTQTIIPLDKSPNCISISEDGNTAVIGYNLAAVSKVDLQTKTLTKTIETDCIPFDIVLGDNDWCYLMPETGNFEYLRSLNLKTSQLVKSTKYGNIYAKMTIRKVPGKPYLLGSNTQVSSNGLIMADISKGIARDTMPYWFIDTNNFWLSPKGEKIYTGVKNIHRTPAFTTTETYFYNLDIIGTLKPQKENIVWVDHCEATNTIFMAESSRYYESVPYSVIEQIDAGNYNFKKLIEPAKYVTTINGNKSAYKTIVKFVFANSSGTQIYVVKNVLEEYKTQAWSMEVIPLN